jgi:hypothetical protein
MRVKIKIGVIKNITRRIIQISFDGRLEEVDSSLFYGPNYPPKIGNQIEVIINDQEDDQRIMAIRAIRN